MGVGPKRVPIQPFAPPHPPIHNPPSVAAGIEPFEATVRDAALAVQQSERFKNKNYRSSYHRLYKNLPVPPSVYNDLGEARNLRKEANTLNTNGKVYDDLACYFDIDGDTAGAAALRAQAAQLFSTSAQHYARASALQKRAQLRMGEIVRAWDESELFKLNETKSADNHAYTRILRDLHRGSKHDGDVFDSSAGLPPPLNKDGVAPDVYLSQHFAEVFKAQAPPPALDDPTLAAGIDHAPFVAEPRGPAINAPLDAHELYHYRETLRQATEGGPRGHYCSPSSPQFTDPSSVKPQPERQHRHYSTPSCPQHS
jgi:hypothetical protein